MTHHPHAAPVCDSLLPTSLFTIKLLGAFHGLSEWCILWNLQTLPNTSISAWPPASASSFLVCQGTLGISNNTVLSPVVFAHVLNRLSQDRAPKPMKSCSPDLPIPRALFRLHPVHTDETLQFFRCVDSFLPYQVQHTHSWVVLRSNPTFRPGS